MKILMKGLWMGKFYIRFLFENPFTESIKIDLIEELHAYSVRDQEI